MLDIGLIMLKFNETKVTLLNTFVLTIDGMIGDADGTATLRREFSDTEENRKILDELLSIINKYESKYQYLGILEDPEFGKFFDEEYGFDDETGDPLPGFEENNPYYIGCWPCEPYGCEKCEMEGWCLTYYDDMGKMLGVTYEKGA